MFAELIDWVLNLDAEFAFLLALPFAVALAGFLSEAVRRPSAKPENGRQEQPLRAPHHAHSHVLSR